MYRQVFTIHLHFKINFSSPAQKKKVQLWLNLFFLAGDETRTRDPQLGRVKNLIYIFLLFFVKLYGNQQLIKNIFLQFFGYLLFFCIFV